MKYVGLFVCYCCLYNNECHRCHITTIGHFGIMFLGLLLTLFPTIGCFVFVCFLIGIEGEDSNDGIFKSKRSEGCRMRSRAVWDFLQT